jgi:hypothetical protein
MRTFVRIHNQVPHPLRRLPDAPAAALPAKLRSRLCAASVQMFGLDVACTPCAVKTLLSAVFLVSVLLGCEKPGDTLRRRSFEDYSKFWRQPGQLAWVKQDCKISDDYKFQSLDLAGGLRKNDVPYEVFEWSFRFVKEIPHRKKSFTWIWQKGFWSDLPVSDSIEIRRVCYYDFDAMYMFTVKEKRTHWLDGHIAESSFKFHGDEEWTRSWTRSRFRARSITLPAER